MDEVKLLPCERGYELANWLSGWLQDKAEDFRPDTIKRFQSIIHHLHATRPTIVTDEVVGPQGLGAIPGSHPADQAPSGLGASRFDPERWRPIETAPKDGTWLLLRGRNSANYPMIPVVCAWRDGAWRDSASLKDMSSLVADVPPDGAADWMPLASVDRSPEGQDGETRLDAKHESAVANGETPTPGRPTIDQDGGWQPIETAPKDGTRIMLWTDTKAGNADLQLYVESIGEGEHFRVAQIGYWNGSNGWEKQLIGEPTHWQPLPEPPAQPEVNQS